ncbi:hypothetical protein C2E23DRAFT_819228 [Lenzites betulinus]|nr:hypothetical protein C2E23DRAFT_819228 [Lenzites betulinus]
MARDGGRAKYACARMSSMFGTTYVCSDPHRSSHEREKVTTAFLRRPHASACGSESQTAVTHLERISQSCWCCNASEFTRASGCP